MRAFLRYSIKLPTSHHWNYCSRKMRYKTFKKFVGDKRMCEMKWSWAVKKGSQSSIHLCNYVIAWKGWQAIILNPSECSTTTLLRPSIASLSPVVALLGLMSWKSSGVLQLHIFWNAVQVIAKVVLPSAIGHFMLHKIKENEGWVSRNSDFRLGFLLRQVSFTLSEKNAKCRELKDMWRKARLYHCSGEEAQSLSILIIEVIVPNSSMDVHADSWNRPPVPKSERKSDFHSCKSQNAHTNGIRPSSCAGFWLMVTPQ